MQHIMYIAVNSENKFGIQKWKTLNNFLSALETLSDQVPPAKRIIVWEGKYSKYVIHFWTQTPFPWRNFSQSISY